jgi:hypothetical protein
VLNFIPQLPLYDQRKSLVTVGQEAWWEPQLLWALSRREISISLARDLTQAVQPSARHYNYIYT